MDFTRKEETRTPKNILVEDGDNRAKIRWHHMGRSAETGEGQALVERNYCSLMSHTR